LKIEVPHRKGKLLIHQKSDRSNQRDQHGHEHGPDSHFDVIEMLLHPDDRLPDIDDLFHVFVA